MTVIGTNVRRIDGVEKVSGQGLYAGDLRFPGMAYAKVLRSPLPHARIRRIDSSKAAALTGVLAVACSLVGVKPTLKAAPPSLLLVGLAAPSSSGVPPGSPRGADAGWVPPSLSRSVRSDHRLHPRAGTRILPIGNRDCTARWRGPQRDSRVAGQAGARGRSRSAPRYPAHVCAAPTGS